MKDAIVAEIHKIRKNILIRINTDYPGYLKELKDLEKKYSKNLGTLPIDPNVLKFLKQNSKKK